MLVPNRHSSSDSYRYGFQGQEKDDELKGEGNSLNYTFRMHDPRVGRFFAIDPLTSKYPFYSPYAFSGNDVTRHVELEGLELGDTFMKFLFPLPPKLQNNIQKNPGAHGLNFGGKAAAISLAAPSVAYFSAESGLALSAGYESYSSWVVGTNSFKTIHSTFTLNNMFNTSLYSFGIFGSTNLLGQYATNGFKFDENINWSQPVFAGVFKSPTMSNFMQSSLSLDTKNGWDFKFFDQDFFASYSSNLLADGFGNKLQGLNFSGNSFAANFMFDLYSGLGTEIGGNIIEGGLKKEEKKEQVKYPWDPNNKDKSKKTTRGCFLANFSNERPNAKPKKK